MTDLLRQQKQYHLLHVSMFSFPTQGLHHLLQLPLAVQRHTKLCNVTTLHVPIWLFVFLCPPCNEEADPTQRQVRLQPFTKLRRVGVKHSRLMAIFFPSLVYVHMATNYSASSNKVSMRKQSLWLLMECSDSTQIGAQRDWFNWYLCVVSFALRRLLHCTTSHQPTALALPEGRLNATFTRTHIFLWIFVFTLSLPSSVTRAFD